MRALLGISNMMLPTFWEVRVQFKREKDALRCSFLMRHDIMISVHEKEACGSLGLLCSIDLLCSIQEDEVS